MKSFNFNKPVLKVNGEPMEVAEGREGILRICKLNESLATNLSLYTKSVTEVEVLKFAEWARTLYRKGVLNLDTGDEKLFRSFVDSLLKTGQLSVVFLDQIYQVLDRKAEIAENGEPAKGNFNEYT